MGRKNYKPPWFLCSHNQMPCHVPRLSLPFVIGTVTLLPIINALAWAGWNVGKIKKLNFETLHCQFIRISACHDSMDPWGSPFRRESFYFLWILLEKNGVSPASFLWGNPSLLEWFYHLKGEPHGWIHRTMTLLYTKPTFVFHFSLPRQRLRV